MSKPPKEMKAFLDWMKTKPKLQKAFDEALAEEEPKKDPPAEDPPAKDEDPIVALASKVEELAILVRGLTEKAPADGDPAGDQETTGDEGPDEDPARDEDDPDKAKAVTLNMEAAPGCPWLAVAAFPRLVNRL
jgi:hypothetical protein